MPKINLSGNSIIDFTPVSDIFICEYMPSANGTYVKVYLYALHNSLKKVSELDTKLIADDLNIIESDVLEALKYWADKNIINLTNTNDVFSVEFIKPQKTDKPTPVAAPKGGLLRMDSRPNYSPEELVLYGKEPEIKQMFMIAQYYLGKPLTPTDLNTLYSFYDWLRLPTSVIELLLEYCISNNHRSMRYIEQVAISWADQGIDNIEKANQQILKFNKKYRTIMKVFGISSREPAPVEIKYMQKWLDEYKLEYDLILEACNRTMQNISQPSFQYADKILNSWYTNNVRTFDDIKAIDDSYAKKKSIKNNKTNDNKQNNIPVKNKNNRFLNFKQRNDWDFDELEKLEQRYQERKLSEGR